MFIKRYFTNLDSMVKPGRVLVIYGPRRVGKTTLLKNYLEGTKYRYKIDSGDNMLTRHVLGSQDFKALDEYIQGYDGLALDEAQQIPHIGMGLKILIDNHPEFRIIATGSSSFDLAQQTGEPLTGRKRTINLFPFSQQELLSLYNRFELSEHLHDFLIFGSYPQVITAVSRKDKITELEELVSSYLLKDIFSLERLRHSRTIFDLLKLLAFQIGSEVSINELATQLGINGKTVERYLDLLEKSFVIFRLGSLSRNLRNEIRSKQKYFFVDTGVRNGIISQFNDISLRDDVGKLWENFIISERMKKRSYEEAYANSYFWRTYEQQEIDLIEEKDGTFFAFEMKWKAPQKISAPRKFSETYTNSEYTVIHPNNYLDYVL